MEMTKSEVKLEYKPIAWNKNNNTMFTSVHYGPQRSKHLILLLTSRLILYSFGKFRYTELP